MIGHTRRFLGQVPAVVVMLELLPTEGLPFCRFAIGWLRLYIDSIKDVETYRHQTQFSACGFINDEERTIYIA